MSRSFTLLITIATIFAIISTAFVINSSYSDGSERWEDFIEKDAEYDLAGFQPISTYKELQNMSLDGNYYLTNDIDLTNVYPENSFNISILIDGTTISFHIVTENDSVPLYVSEATITVNDDTTTISDGKAAVEITAAGNYIITAYGTASNISSGLDLRFAVYVSGTETDINDAIVSSKCNFEPIGTSDSPFTGTFNGNGHIIKGLNVIAEDETGLFAYADGAVIMNVGIVDGSIKSLNSTAGGLIGYATGTTIVTNSYNTGKISAGTGSIGGGLIGYANSTATITNSYNTGSIFGEIAGGLIGNIELTATITNSYNKGTISAGIYAGGLIGAAYSTATITNSYNTGKISADGFAGGLIGYAHSTATITNSYNTGDVSGSYAGGLIGNASSPTITNSYNTGEISAGNDAGGLIGNAYSTAIITSSYVLDTSVADGKLVGNDNFTDLEDLSKSKTDELMKKQETFKNWNFDGIWGIDENNGYPYHKFLERWENFMVDEGKDYVPYGTDPTDWKELNNSNFTAVMKDNSIDKEGNYYLTESIYLSENFIPVGTTGGAFKGTFDGNGYVIFGLTIDVTGKAGLFAYADGATVKNVGLEYGSVISLDGDAGGLIGHIESDSARSIAIINSYNTGPVTAISWKAGGLIGSVENDKDVTITNSYNTGDVSGSEAGGLIGFASSTATITNSYNKGNVTATDFKAGGLIGNIELTATITNSYNTGTISAGSEAGGLIGNADSTVTIINSYNTESISGSYAGGLIGNADSTNITNSYNVGGVTATNGNAGGLIGNADSTATIISSYALEGVGATNLVGNDGTSTYDGLSKMKSDTLMKKESTFTGWDFYGTWKIIEDQDYPYLEPLGRWANFMVDKGKDYVPYGTDPADWKELNNSNFTTVMTDESIDKEGNYYLTENIYLSENFIPVGTLEFPFKGTFDGNGYVIFGLTIKVDGNVGLFANADGATIKNLGIEKGSITSNSGFAGALIGNADETTTIINSYNTGTIDGYYAGGLIGTAYSTTITNSYNTGTISGSYAGGLIGRANSTATITNSYNTGSISGSYAGGGLIGDASSTTITNSYNMGTVSGSYAGGLIGEASSTTITNSYNMGTISGYDTGGLIGWANSTATITNSYNTGTVSGSGNGSRAGGLIGEASSTATITNSYNTGTVSGSYAGGLIGLNFGSQTIIINSSYALSGVGADNLVGNDSTGTYDGLSGMRTSDQMKERSTFINWDLKNIWAIDPNINGNYPYLTGYSELPLIIISYGTGGKIMVKEGETDVNNGEKEYASKLDIAITVESGYKAYLVMINGTENTDILGALNSSTGSYSYTIYLAGDHIVEVYFKPILYAVELEFIYDEGGSVPPAAAVWMNAEFTFTLNEAVGVSPFIYSTNNIDAEISDNKLIVEHPTGDPTVEVDCKYLVETNISQGTITSTEPIYIDNRGEGDITFIPDTGYEFDTVFVVEPNAKAELTSEGTITVSNVTGPCTVTIKMKKIIYTVEAEISEGGTITSDTPLGISYMEEGEFTFTIDNGYQYKGVSVDPGSNAKAELTSDGTITVSNVTGPCTINIELEKIKYTVRITSTSGGTTSPSGINVMDHGSSMRISFSPSSGHELIDVKINGSSVRNIRNADSMMITVTSNMNIEAIFSSSGSYLHVYAGEGGYAYGSGYYDNGSTVTIYAAAMDGYEFRGWSDNIPGATRSITVNGDTYVTAYFEKTSEFGNMTISNGDAIMIILIVIIIIGAVIVISVILSRRRSS